MSEISISSSNKKMGGISSVSLPSVVTCRECACQKKCYARKLERLRPSVAKAYKRNLDVLRNDPNTYWREVEAAIMLSRFFRVHVSGDIPDSHYLRRMIGVAQRNQHCHILCFTKKYELVNEYLSGGEVIPENLHIILGCLKTFILLGADRDLTATNGLKVTYRLIIYYPLRNLDGKSGTLLVNTFYIYVAIHHL